MARISGRQCTANPDGLATRRERAGNVAVELARVRNGLQAPRYIPLPLRILRVGGGEGATHIEGVAIKGKRSSKVALSLARIPDQLQALRLIGLRS